MSVRIYFHLLVFSRNLEKGSEILFQGIGLSFCPSKHLGFGFRVILETLVCKVVRVSHKTLV